jgi:hypothetical protein
VPTLELDHTFESKEDIAHTIRDNLRDVRGMDTYIVDNMNAQKTTLR